MSLRGPLPSLFHSISYLVSSPESCTNHKATCIMTSLGLPQTKYALTLYVSVLHVDQSKRHLSQPSEIDSSTFQMISHRSLGRRSLWCIIVGQRGTKGVLCMLYIVVSIWYHWKRFNCTERFTCIASRHRLLPCCPWASIDIPISTHVLLIVSGLRCTRLVCCGLEREAKNLFCTRCRSR